MPLYYFSYVDGITVDIEDPEVLADDEAACAYGKRIATELAKGKAGPSDAHIVVKSHEGQDVFVSYLFR